MSDFVASNGVTVYLGAGGHLDLLSPNVLEGTCLSSLEADALREFFRDERDRELGRWRWPENPEYVVYPKMELVLNEREAFRQPLLERWEADLVRDSEDEFNRAAVAYYEAHPEPKPWQDAKPGEVWVFTFGDGGLTHAAVLTDDGVWQWSDGGAVHLDEVTAGRRIWPEATP